MDKVLSGYIKLWFSACSELKRLGSNEALFCQVTLLRGSARVSGESGFDGVLLDNAAEKLGFEGKDGEGLSLSELFNSFSVTKPGSLVFSAT
ncbi:hypothetical protein [Bowmanella denitrificans]|uniref:hypothetical protein n=1 Tax=Bowmanella denitrificans TaxID=366582 RepID=UPI0031DD0A1E